MNVRNTRNYDSNVTISFDTSKVRLDMNNRAYIECNSDTDSNTKVVTDSNNIVTSITFNMPKETSENIKFYKASSTDAKLASNYEEWQNIFTVEREKNN